VDYAPKCEIKKKRENDDDGADKETSGLIGLGKTKEGGEKRR